MQLLLGVASFLFAHNHDRAAFEECRAANDGRVIAVKPIAVNLLKIGEKALDIVECMGALGMTRELDPLPRLRTGSAQWGFRQRLFSLNLKKYRLRFHRQFASTSIASVPQIFSSSARNSRSGRTFRGTSRITEKSRGS